LRLRVRSLSLKFIVNIHAVSRIVIVELFDFLDDLFSRLLGALAGGGL
jgi:hypothetical protein